jgi:hypothetical protein
MAYEGCWIRCVSFVNFLATSSSRYIRVCTLIIIELRALSKFKGMDYITKERIVNDELKQHADKFHSLELFIWVSLI